MKKQGRVGCDLGAARGSSRCRRHAPARRRGCARARAAARARARARTARPAQSSRASSSALAALDLGRRGRRGAAAGGLAGRRADRRRHRGAVAALCAACGSRARAAGPGLPDRRDRRGGCRKLGENGTSLAARLPVLRPAVCRQLIAAASKRNALISAAIFIPGVDMPVLTLNQARLVLRIALAYGAGRRPAARRRAARSRRRRLRVPRGRPRAARPDPGRRLGGQGRDRLRRHEGDRRGGRALLRSASVARRRRSVRSWSYALPNSTEVTRMALTGHQEAMELLLIEEADAWFEYLEATRGAVRAPLRRARAVGVGPPLTAPARDPRPPRQAAACRRSRVSARRRKPPSLVLCGSGLCQGFSIPPATRARFCHS